MSEKLILNKMMLASDMPDDVKFPVYASFKYDGVRASAQNGMFYQRSLKPVVNEHIQWCISDFFGSIHGNGINGFDGELISGKCNEEATFRRTTGDVRRKDGEPDFTFYVFDIMGQHKFLSASIKYLEGVFKYQDHILPPWIKLIEQRLLHNMEEVRGMTNEALKLGYEGLVIRDPQGFYKNGRATAKQQQLMRIVPWERDEATIIGFEEQCTNTNPKIVNELGRSSRSTHKENMVPNGKLGAFLLRHTNGMEFKVGNGDGLTPKLRKEIWESRDSYLSLLLNYRHKTVGGYDKPRQAQYMGIRSEDDLGGE